MARRRTLVAVALTDPAAPGTGYTLRVRNLAAALAREWELALLLPGAAPADARWAGDAEIVPVPARIDPGAMHTLAPPETAAFRRVLDEQLAARRPDALLLWLGAEFLAEGDAPRPPVVLDRIDSLTLTTCRQLRREARLPTRLRALRDAVAFARRERRMVRRARRTVVVGEDDARWLRRLSGRDTVHVVPNGVTLPAAPATPADEAADPTVIFSGVLSYPPNEDAARYAAEEIWPLVRARMPEARLELVGRDPSGAVLALADRPGVQVLANVPDMDAVLRRAWLSVAPMRAGSGIKNKVLEAWAVGRPVVMSPMATNGLALDAAGAALVADGPAAMAELIVRLLRDPDERRRHGAAALAGAATYERSWTAMAERLGRVVELACADRGGGAG